MKLSFLYAAAFLALALNASGGTLIVSGDSSIAYSVTGGNATFFSNVLGSGTSVLIQELESQTAGNGANIAAYYNGTAGVTATQTTATSVSDLGGVNLFISMLPQSAYSAAELSAMSTLLSAGGTLFLIGESSGYAGGNTAMPYLNGALTSLGSSLTIGGSDGSAYPVTAITVPNALTSGVTNFQYGFTALVSGGTPLFQTVNGTPFVEVQTLGGTATPEPASAWMVLGAIAMGGFLLRRKKI